MYGPKKDKIKQNHGKTRGQIKHKSKNPPSSDTGMFPQSLTNELTSCLSSIKRWREQPLFVAEHRVRVSWKPSDQHAYHLLLLSYSPSLSPLRFLSLLNHPLLSKAKIPLKKPKTHKIIWSTCQTGKRGGRLPLLKVHNVSLPAQCGNF